MTEAQRIKRRAAVARYRAKYPERARESNRKSKAKHGPYKENKPRKRETHLYRTYGLSLQEYDALLLAQGGGCGICGKKPQYSLFVDHDHQTNKVRGILCAPCNHALGAFGDTIEGLRCALAYLEQSK